MNLVVNGNITRSPELAHANAFPSPFLDYASLVLPKTLDEAYEVAELMYYNNGSLAQAIGQIVSYFMTDVKIVSQDEEKSDEYQKFLMDKLRLKTEMFKIGRDLKIYGNSCLSIIAPFKRFLLCKSCGAATPISDVPWKFQLNKGFNYSCPKCGKNATSHKPEDRPTLDENKLVVKRWRVRNMKANFHEYGNEIDYYYKIPPEDIAKINRGDKKFLEEVPWGIVEAVRKNRMFQFAPGMVYHASLGNLSDTKMGIWSVPPVIGAFKDAYLVQILKRNNEVIALDHMLPIRMISPSKQPVGGLDTMRGMNLASFGALTMRAIEKAKKDPSGWMYFPSPIDYQLLNGDGKNFVVPDLLENANADFLNAIGIPVEMYRKTLSAQNAPFAARLFEAGEVIFFEELRRIVSWIVDRVSAILGWGVTQATLMRPSVADDLDRRMILLQMMMGGLAAEQDVLQLFNLDWKETFDKRMQEQEYKLKKEKEYADRLQKAEENDLIMQGAGQAAMGALGPGGMPPGGMPVGGDMGMGGPPPMMGGVPAMPLNGVAGGAQGQQGVDVETYMADAQSRADYIAMSFPLGSPERRQALTQLKQTDNNMHALVKDILDSMTQDAEAQGRQQLSMGQPMM